MSRKRKVGPDSQPTVSGSASTWKMQFPKRVSYDQETFDDVFGYTPAPSKSILDKYNLRKISSKWFLTKVYGLFPISLWLPKYNVKTNLVSDVIAGLTVGVLHIPQGMGYAMLANVPAVYGLYVSIFPALIYFVFGTSRYASIGTFAIISLMLSQIISWHIARETEAKGVHSNNATDWTDEKVEVAVAACFSCGLLQILLSIFHLGALGSLLSESLIAGFISGSAIQVVTSQLQYLFGLSVNTNAVTASLSVSFFCVLYLCHSYLQKVLQKALLISVPFDLVAIIFGTFLSMYFELRENYSVMVVGFIQTGLPYPKLPNFDLAVQVLVECFPIAIISFVTGFAMSSILAKKHKDRLGSNQELFAMGLSNVGSSFFLCFPCGISLSRTVVVDNVGGKSQISGLIACLLVMVVLVSIARWFEELPVCVLACIILVALKKMLLGVRESLYYFKISFLEGLIWLVTFLSVLFAPMDVALLISIIFKLIVTFSRTAFFNFCFFPCCSPYSCLYGNVVGTNIYVDVNAYKKAKQIRQVAIFHFNGPLYFGNCRFFRNRLVELIGIDPRCQPVNPQKITGRTLRSLREIEKEESRIPLYYLKLQGKDVDKNKYRLPIKFIIVDFSAITQLDYSGYRVLEQIMEEYLYIGITVLFASCSQAILDVLRKTRLCEFPLKRCIFPTVHDAVVSARSKIPKIPSVDAKK